MSCCLFCCVVLSLNDRGLIENTGCKLSLPYFGKRNRNSKGVPIGALTGAWTFFYALSFFHFSSMKVVDFIKRKKKKKGHRYDDTNFLKCRSMTQQGQVI